MQDEFSSGKIINFNVTEIIMALGENRSTSRNLPS